MNTPPNTPSNTPPNTPPNPPENLSPQTVSPPSEDTNIPLIRAENLSRHFPSVHAVKQFSLSVQQGEIVALLGANGAGKTTTMRMLAGVLEPSSGHVFFKNYNLLKNRIQCQKQLGYVPEGAPQWPLMTPLQRFSFRAQIMNIQPHSPQWDSIIHTTHIKHVLNKPIGTLSKGYQRRVALADAFIHNPQVLILDEPTDGLDPRQKLETHNFLAKSAADKAIIISTHILEDAAAICSRVVIFHQGQILQDLPMNKLPPVPSIKEGGATLERLHHLFFTTTSENQTTTSEHQPTPEHQITTPGN
jgi:ABC-type multidrug transport system ATPase subunit